MKKILVPTGYSAASANAIAYAGDVAKTLNREIVFFHMGMPVQEPVLSSSGGHDEVPEPIDVSALHNFMVKSHVDLVVMGMPGTGEESYSGSLLPVLGEFSCPVLLIPAGYTSHQVGKIGLASGITQLDHELGKIIPFARCFNAGIEIFHVSSWTADIAGFERFNLRHEIEMAKRLHQYANISYGVDELPVDNENENITSFLSEKKVDILATFQNTSPEIESLYGIGNAGTRFNPLRIPVLVFPK